ncbi:MAG TPA: SsrA-binding protein SmpB [Candidatus Dojkabacteria bacterium]|nr:SsrA-binding protein SmpB [Candidatus Dojkabacteria bacterium]
MKIINKKARFDYEILESFEVGIVLLGMEVKSVKSGRVNISDAFVKIIGDELWLVNADITKYQYASDDHYDSKRTRKLLIKRNQLDKLESKMKQGNLTLIPLSIYTVRGYVKVEIGLARGKKYHEKRKAEKERDMDRDLLYESRKFVV